MSCPDLEMPHSLSDVQEHFFKKCLGVTSHTLQSGSTFLPVCARANINVCMCATVLTKFAVCAHCSVLIQCVQQVSNEQSICQIVSLCVHRNFFSQNVFKHSTKLGQSYFLYD